MGPLHDEQGLEQGGSSSSELYKIFGKEQLLLAQKSSLGVKMGNVVVSSVGMADDTALLSNDIHHLYYLLELSKFFCSKYEASLCPEKTILQVYQPKQLSADSYEIYNPIKIDGRSNPFSSTADHVGILRSTNGNKPTLLARISAHKRALVFGPKI